MKTAITFIFVFICAMAFGETIHVDSLITITTDSTVVNASPDVPTWKTIFTFQNFLIAFAGIYEIAVRIYPTSRNWSALSLIYNIVNMIIPNAKKDGTKHK